MSTGDVRLRALVYKGDYLAFQNCGFHVIENKDAGCHIVEMQDVDIIILKPKPTDQQQQVGEIFGLQGWGWENLSLDKKYVCDIPSFPYKLSRNESEEKASSSNPNTAKYIDHCVLYAKSGDFVKSEFEKIRFPFKRERKNDSFTQMFFRSNGGGIIVEVVVLPNVTDYYLWGLTLTVQDIEYAKENYFNDDGKASNVRDAVQKNRKIMTLRHKNLNLFTNIAMISPHVKD